MSETVFVDLSAKVEQWNKNTAVAFSNGIKGSILISKKVKKAARNWLKTEYPNHSTTFYCYNLLTVWIYLLLKPNLERIGHIVIDKDYPGQESEKLIKDFLLNFLHRDKPTLRGSFISFQEVRGSCADILARDIYQNKKEANRKITLEDIRQLWR